MSGKLLDEEESKGRARSWVARVRSWHMQEDVIVDFQVIAQSEVESSRSLFAEHLSAKCSVQIEKWLCCLCACRRV